MNRNCFKARERGGLDNFLGGGNQDENVFMFVGGGGGGA